MTNQKTHKDRVYHGIDDDESARILVEPPAGGPTQRERLNPLYEIPCPRDGDYGWGYNGTGTSRAAAAVLSDALDIDRTEIWLASSNEVLVELREDFCVEVLRYMCPDWRLGRNAVLRWASAWYAQHGITPPPCLTGATT